tara:strand:+ start:7777 stop:7998 length:222 start_codon:yes stop_codon:yes gene_type:complete
MELLGQYKIRKLTSKNKTGDVVGITLPKDIDKIFERVSTTINVFVSGTVVILESGTKMTKGEIYEFNKKQRPF